MKKTRSSKKSLLDEVTDEQLKDLLLKGNTPTEIAYILKSPIVKVYNRLSHIPDLPPDTKLVYKKKRTPQELQDLTSKAVEIIKKGYTFEEVDKILNIPKGYTSKLLRINGINTKELISESKRNRKFREDKEPTQRAPRSNSKEIDLLCKQIVELLKKGYTLKEAKKQLNIPNASVSKWLSYRRIDISELIKNRKKLKQEEFLRRIKEATEESVNLTEASVKAGINYFTILDNYKKLKNEHNTIR